MGLAVRRLWREALCSLGVLAVVGTIAFGLPAFDRAVPGTRAVPPDQPYGIGGGIVVIPPPGAVLDVTRTRPRTDRGTVLFVLGEVRYAILVSPYSGDLTAAAVRLRRRLHDAGGYVPTAPASPVTTASGIAGLSGDLTGPHGRAGRYAVYVVGPRVVEATATGPAGALSGALTAVDASLASIRGAP
jgi:hypothetical protein